MRSSSRITLFLIAAWVAAVASCDVAAQPSEIPSGLGLPFTRTYSLDEIGHVSRGATLGFDPLGRLAVTNDGAYVVLNDQTWIDLADRREDADTMICVTPAKDGKCYYGSGGSWGQVIYTKRGKLRPLSFRPDPCPAWIALSNFNQIVPTEKGIFFGSWNGVVFSPANGGEQRFCQIPEVVRVFTFNRQVYVSSRVQGLQKLEISDRELKAQPMEGETHSLVLDRCAILSENRMVASTYNKRLVTFDGHTATPWGQTLRGLLQNGISDVERLADGKVAIAIRERGLYILSDDGRLLASYEGPEFQSIQDLAANEPGIVWAATESGVMKVLYGSNVSIIDQRVGIPVKWPQVVRWKGDAIIDSDGRLYDSSINPTTGATKFHLMKGQPSDGAWALAVAGDTLLVGNKNGIYARLPDQPFELILPGIEVARLAMIAPETCIVIGSTEVAVLKREGDKWIECCNRAPAYGYPAVVHTGKNSVWVELGTNRVSHISLNHNKLASEVFTSFPWKEQRWVTVGLIGQIAVLTGPANGRIYYDEDKMEFGPAPELEQLLRRSPLWVGRVSQDESGTIWASHEEGVTRLINRKERGGVELLALDNIHDRCPLVQIVGGSDVWVSSGSALYHVDTTTPAQIEATPQPILASAVDARTGDELFNAAHPSSLGSLAFERNSVSFRFFAGGYSLPSPTYEMKMASPSHGWSIAGADSLLTLPDLREGRYILSVRASDARGPVGLPLTVPFIIRPPWYRTGYAYVGYVLLLGAGVTGLVRWFGRRHRARNATLQELVGERTAQLEQAMIKLNEETRTAATLAERDRLAGEIHDSLQQSLNGLMLQVDATLKIPNLADDVRSRLSTARNMVSFTRDEVQNAVWNLESPLLESSSLEEALHNIANFVSPGTDQIKVDISGTAFPLSSSIKHHLLRIAQEAITNATKHGAAQHIKVELIYSWGGVTLRVTDDGCGFDPKEIMTKRAGHFGLRGLRTRASKIGGKLEITSEPGHGASVTITAPVSDAKVNLTHATII